MSFLNEMNWTCRASKWSRSSPNLHIPILIIFYPGKYYFYKIGIYYYISIFLLWHKVFGNNITHRIRLNI